jgi:hypothetical protein
MKTAFEATGDIRTVDLLAAFVSTWRGQGSGSARFIRPGSTAGFDFADGEVVAAFSSDPRFETAAILVRAGKLDQTALERLTVPAGTDGALAALQAGILTRREWKWGEKIRSIEILAELLGWLDGKYLFDAQARPSRGEFSLAIPRLLLELFLRSRDRHLIDHQLGSVDLPLVRSENFDQEFMTFGLTADAESVVRLIDGRASASEICERAPAEEFSVLKLLAALRTLGLIEPGQAEGSASLPEGLPASGRDLGPEADKEETAPEPAGVTDQEEFALEEGTPPPPPAAASEEFGAGAPSEARVERESPEPGLDVEVGEIAPGWEGPPGEQQWKAVADDLDRELDTAIEPPEESRKGGRRRGILLGALLGLLVVAVGAILFVRSRHGTAETSVAEVRTPAWLPTRQSVTAPPPSATAPSSPSRSPTLPTRASRPAVTAQPSKATPVPTGSSGGRREPGRSEWIARARADRRKLDSDRRTRYAIQLELACETPSLAEAWKHDRPGGSMWLLPLSHGGKDCFRVLWGRFSTLEAARKAKGGIPPFFNTATNHPAVVAVR